MEALNAPAEEATIARGEQPLLAAALLLAGLYAGADDDTMSRLRRLGSAWSGLDADALDAAIASDLKAALTAGT
jgi:hypothetical protein